MAKTQYEILISVQQQLAGLNQTIAGLEKGTAQATSFGQSLKTGLGISIMSQFTAGLQSLTSGFENLISRGVKFNAEMTGAEDGIAAVLGKFQGLNREASKLEAAKAMQQIAELEPRTAGGLSDLVQGFMATVASAQSVGMSVSENIDLVGRFANAVSRVNLPIEQLAQEARSIFTGNITQDSALAKTLGITNADVEKAKAAGNLYEWLRDKIGELGVAGDTFTVRWSTLNSTISKSAGVISKPVYDELFLALDRLNAEIQRAAGSNGLQQLGIEAGHALQKLTDLAIYAMRNADTLTSVGKAALYLALNLAAGRLAAAALAGGLPLLAQRVAALTTALGGAPTIIAAVVAQMALLVVDSYSEQVDRQAAAVQKLVRSYRDQQEAIKAIATEEQKRAKTSELTDRLASIQNQINDRYRLLKPSQRNTSDPVVAELTQQKIETQNLLAMTQRVSAVDMERNRIAKSTAGVLEQQTRDLEAFVQGFTKLQQEVRQQQAMAAIPEDPRARMEALAARQRGYVSTLQRVGSEAGLLTSEMKSISDAADLLGSGDIQLGLLSPEQQAKVKEFADVLKKAQAENVELQAAEQAFQQQSLASRQQRNELDRAFIRNNEDAKDPLEKQLTAVERQVKIAEERDRLTSQYQDALQTGEVTQEQINKLAAENVDLAEAKRKAQEASKEAAKGERDALKEARDLLQDAQSAISAVDSNPFLTRGEKDAQKSGLLSTERTALQGLQAQGQNVNADLGQNAIEQRLTTPMGQFQAKLTDWANSFGTIAEQAADAITNTLGSAIDGVSNGIYGLVSGTMSWGQAMRQTAASIVQDLIRIGVRMMASWLLEKGIMVARSIFGETMRAKDTASVVANQSAQAAVTAPNAMLQSVASYGAAALAGAAAFAAAMAAAGSFASGGYTGDGGKYQVAGMVHRGEYVMDAATTRRIGVENLDRMRTNAARSGVGSGLNDADVAATAGASGGTGKVVVVFDKQALAREMASSDAFERATVVHVNRNRTETGMRG